jgi:hypothetical protein
LRFIPGTERVAPEKLGAGEICVAKCDVPKHNIPFKLSLEKSDATIEIEFNKVARTLEDCVRKIKVVPPPGFFWKYPVDRKKLGGKDNVAPIASSL